MLSFDKLEDSDISLVMGPKQELKLRKTNHTFEQTFKQTRTMAMTINWMCIWESQRMVKGKFA